MDDRHVEERILVAGETLIDFLPERPGPLSAVDGFERRPGGAPANVAVALARLDRPPLFWTRVGDDPFGRYLAEVLADRGLSETHVELDPDARTSLAFVTHDASGDRTFSFYRDGTADTRLDPAAIDDLPLGDLEWVHVGGVTLSSGRSREATLELLARAAAAGCTTSFDPNARPELWPSDADFARVCREAIEHVSVLKATADELETIGFEGETPRARGEAVLAMDDGPHTVFVTRGGEGAIALASERAPWVERADGNAAGPAAIAVDHPGYAVDVIDTTGAGDAFVAGAIAALRDGEGLAETLAFASAVAATATTAPGAMTALPDREAVRSFRASAERS